MACVLVHIEAEGDRPTPASLGALGAGRRLASKFGATLYAAVLTAAAGDNDHDNAAESSVRIGPVDAASLGRAPLVDELARAGADKVVFVTVDRVQYPPLWVTAGGALASACQLLRPLVVIVPTSRGGHDIAPRLAARLGAAYIPDAVLDLALGGAAAGPGGPVGVHRTVYGTYTRKWVLDDVDRAVVIAVADGTTPTRGDDDAEVMLLAADPEGDGRITAEPAAVTVPDAVAATVPDAAAATVPDAAAATVPVTVPVTDAVAATVPVTVTVTVTDAVAATVPVTVTDTDAVAATVPVTVPATATAPATSAPSNIAVLVRGLLSGPGARAVAPLGDTERAAIAAAVELGRARGVSIVAVAAGAAAIHDRALAAALAAGCTRAIRIDTTLADEIDYLGLAQILAQGVRKADAGIILCGDRSSDEGTGAVGPAVAELIDAAHLTGVDAVELAAGTVIARRGHERYRITPTSVLCIASASAIAATTAAAGSSESPAVEVMSLDDLGLDPRVLAHRRMTAGAIVSTANVDTVPGIPVPDFGPEPA